MGSILKRKDRYTAVVRKKKGGKIILTESKTFGTEKDAKKWIQRREVELDKAGIGELDETLSAVIDKYVEAYGDHIGRTKTQVLRTIKKSGFANTKCSKITASKLSEWIAGIPGTSSTKSNYFSHLSAVASVARPLWGYNLNPDVFREARTALFRTGIIGKSRERSRRPTVEELNALLDHFTEAKNRNQTLPMVDLIIFAMFSARRQEEICRIKWSDLDGDRILVRDMKHPGQKVGNDVICDLPAEAVAVIQRQPRVAEEIFPYNSRSVSASFTRAAAFLEINDLHFHDLRHEATSRLFEMNLNLPRVAAVTGHRSWTSLKRYTHLRHAGDRWAQWKHNPLVTAASGACGSPSTSEV